MVRGIISHINGGNLHKLSPDLFEDFLGLKLPVSDCF